MAPKNEEHHDLNDVCRRLDKLRELVTASTQQTASQLAKILDRTAVIGQRLSKIEDLLVNLDAATGGKLRFAAGNPHSDNGARKPMDNFNPKTQVNAAVAFTKDNGDPGQVQGQPIWLDDNTTDTLTIAPDGMSATINGSGNSGDGSVVSNITVTADGNLGAGVKLIALTGSITWDDSDIEATGGTLTLVAAEATPEQVSAHKAALAKRR